MYVDNNPLKYIDPDGRDKYNLKGIEKFVPGVGQETAIKITVDTEYLELGLEVSVSSRVGKSAGASFEGSVEPSSEIGNQMKISVSTDVTIGLVTNSVVVTEAETTIDIREGTITPDPPTGPKVRLEVEKTENMLRLGVNAGADAGATVTTKVNIAPLEPVNALERTLNSYFGWKADRSRR